MIRMKNDKKLYSFGQVILRPIYKIIYKIKYKPTVIGSENIPKNGPIILCGNHIHTHDQFNVILYTNRVVHYMAKDEYFKGKFAWFFRISGCIPVDRSIHDENAKSLAMDVLNNNGALGIFPEGTRNKTFGTSEEVELLPFKFGAVSMAKKTGALIVPFGIRGSYTGKDGHLTTHIGEPFSVSDMELEEANNILREKILELMHK